MIYFFKLGTKNDSSHQTNATNFCHNNGEAAKVRLCLRPISDMTDRCFVMETTNSCEQLTTWFTNKKASKCLSLH